ncbi:hypothetical protein [Rhodovulum visakhapatnamense]|uniref:Uncharacterized protein n=1 Tax=Rhodovulum visakhapatnamense TaxID=364297 RepID=A0ABS1RHV9_9RHOB|nr:hypothetical protein [Rhodovulum visakhapatnamense]MBL3579231.1 hypothetical protein [Rhodovulum visakhapatnamense]
MRRICAEVAGIDEATCDQTTAQSITCHATRIYGATLPDPWENPRAIEKEIDGIRAEIRKLRKRIQALDGHARSLARNHADRNEREDVEANIVSSIKDGDDEALRTSLERLNEYSARPKGQWVDFAALTHLDALEVALIGPAERAIAAAGTGPGRRPDRRAYRTAAAAARAFRDLTGTDPTFWNGGETPFSRMLVRIYQCAGIKADLRKPIEAAMHELRSDSRN